VKHEPERRVRRRRRNDRRGEDNFQRLTLRVYPYNNGSLRIRAIDLQGMRFLGVWLVVLPPEVLACNNDVGLEIDPVPDRMGPAMQPLPPTKPEKS
jgi:hypothetical protein